MPFGFYAESRLSGKSLKRFVVTGGGFMVDQYNLFAGGSPPFDVRVFASWLLPTGPYHSTRPLPEVALLLTAVALTLSMLDCLYHPDHTNAPVPIDPHSGYIADAACKRDGHPCKCMTGFPKGSDPADNQGTGQSEFPLDVSNKTTFYSNFNWTWDVPAGGWHNQSVWHGCLPCSGNSTGDEPGNCPSGESWCPLVTKSGSGSSSWAVCDEPAAQCEFEGGKAKPFNKNLTLFVTDMVLFGAVVGQLTFGFLADVFGRRRCFIATLCCVAVGSIIGGLGFPLDDTETGPDFVYILLGLSHLLIGFGVGGEYPLSASVSREKFGNYRSVGLTFSMQGVGMVMASLVILVLLGIGGETVMHVKWIWRLSVGVIPFVVSICLLPFRIQMKETTAYKKLNSSETIGQHLTKTNIIRLIGCAGSWFLFDITFYGNALIAPDAVNYIFQGSDLMDNVIHNLIVAAIALPGYYLAIWWLDKISGLKQLQLFGFTMTTICYGTLSVLYYMKQQGHIAGEGASFHIPVLILYGGSFLFTNCGANTSTFILPVLLFETRVRATFHGISAASGKIGGLIGTTMFQSLKSRPNQEGFPIIMAICTGIILTLATLPWDCENQTSEVPHSPNLAVQGDEDDEDDDGDDPDQF
eukprot:gene6376-1136_t